MKSYLLYFSLTKKNAISKDEIFQKLSYICGHKLTTRKIITSTRGAASHSYLFKFVG